MKVLAWRVGILVAILAVWEAVVRPLRDVGRVPRGERDEVAGELAREWVRGLEQACLEQPYQWFNFYDVWEEG